MTTIDVLAEIGKQNRGRIKDFCFCLVDYSHDEDKLSGLEVELFHRKNIEEVYVKNDDELTDRVKQLEAEGFFLNSRVRLIDDVEAHIILVDFSISVSVEHTKVVKDSLLHLGITHGYILDSGSSYHYIGTDIVSDSDYKRWLCYAYLLSPITDGRWIAHQLIEGSCNLRVGEKKGQIPTIVEKL